MPLSGAETGKDQPVPGQALAVVAEALYLANLLVLPGLAFAVLLVLYLQRVRQAPPLAACHLRQTFVASLWAGVVLVVINGLIIVFGGGDSPITWLLVIIYFTTVHASLVLLGTLGLARAMAGKHFHFPLIGPACPEMAGG
jgi:4-hydroxybenzoate polyprenyltransferase